MKKRVLFSLLIIVFAFALIGCEKEDKEEINRIQDLINNPQAETRKTEPNMKLGVLWFYVPKSEFTYRPDLRGLAYSEDEKKVFLEGDYENDPDNVISIVVYSSNMGMGANQYTNQINSNFTDQDVKYVMKKNDNIIEIYAREAYVIGNNVNYAYNVDKAGLIYVVNIKGPNTKFDEISKLAIDIHSSLLFS